EPPGLHVHDHRQVAAKPGCQRGSAGRWFLRRLGSGGGCFHGGASLSDGVRGFGEFAGTHTPAGRAIPRVRKKPDYGARDGLSSRFSRGGSSSSPLTRYITFSATLVAWSPMRSMFLAMNIRCVAEVAIRGSCSIASTSSRYSVL